MEGEPLFIIRIHMIRNFFLIKPLSRAIRIIKGIFAACSYGNKDRAPAAVSGMNDFVDAKEAGTCKK